LILLMNCWIGDITFAGFPAATLLGGISLVTIEPAPTMELGPIVQLGRTITESPRKQFS